MQTKQTENEAQTAIILEDGSYGGLDGATIFTVPTGFDWDQINDEKDIFAALDRGMLTTIAEFV